MRTQQEREEAYKNEPIWPSRVVRGSLDQRPNLLIDRLRRGCSRRSRVEPAISYRRKRAPARSSLGHESPRRRARPFSNTPTLPPPSLLPIHPESPPHDERSGGDGGGRWALATVPRGQHASPRGSGKKKGKRREGRTRVRASKRERNERREAKSHSRRWTRSCVDSCTCASRPRSTRRRERNYVVFDVDAVVVP